MTLITSVSGIRGTIGGSREHNLTPEDLVWFVAAYASWLKKEAPRDQPRVVVGRDARVSGPMVKQLVLGTLAGMGVDVLDLDLATTPTVEMAVMHEAAHGGIIITASHNPYEWNALKLLNNYGEFLSALEGEKIVEMARAQDFDYATANNLGRITYDAAWNIKHIEQILELPEVDTGAIRNAGFKVAVDCVNSVGGIVVPELLRSLGVREVVKLHCEPDGLFPHNPEPLAENLTELSRMVTESGAHVGFAVDPDVDRLAIISENGGYFGEEYTLVAVADYILQQKPGNTVSNLSSSRALKDITMKYGGTYVASAVGEAHVVEKMKETNAVIGGEGNGGVIFPALHFGRDALVAIALFLSYMARENRTCSQLRKWLPDYHIAKKKIEIDPRFDFDSFKKALKEQFPDADHNLVDGIRLDFQEAWVHIRKSNTEPVIRIIAESSSAEDSEKLIRSMMDRLK
jgi:phosphomannomutase